MGAFKKIFFQLSSWKLQNEIMGDFLQTLTFKACCPEHSTIVQTTQPVSTTNQKENFETSEPSAIIAPLI